MARSPLIVREADKDDLPVLVALLEELTTLGPRRPGRVPRSAPQERAELEERFVAAMADPDQRLLVVVAGREVVGMTLLVLEAASRLVAVPLVTMGHVMVAESYRGRGAGRALLAAALAFGEERGVEAVAVDVYPTHRETNRYYARLGFAPVVTRRVAALATLRRQLGHREAVPEAAVAERRRMRMRVRARAVRARAAGRGTDPG